MTPASSAAPAAAAAPKAARPEAGTTAEGGSRPVAAANAIGLGFTVAVSGSKVAALVRIDRAEGGGNARQVLQMGGLVKIPTANNIAYGIISGLSVPNPENEGEDNCLRLIELELIGECVPDASGKPPKFRRGISTFPTLGDAVYSVTSDDLRLVYVRPTLSTVRIGAIHQDRTLAASIGVDDLLGKHFAIVGATGSGKSCATALILRNILTHNPNSHVLLLDPHNEYSAAFGDMAETINAGSLQLPYWLFNFQEFSEVLSNVGVTVGTPEAAILNEFIPAAKRSFLGQTGATRRITADTPTPYRLTQVLQYIDDIMGRLERPDTLEPYQRLKSAITSLLADARFAFMYGNTVTMRDNMGAIVSRLFRLPVEGKPITILDLSGIPTEILNVVVSVICRMAFDFALWSDGAVPILLVCEEAHRYVPEDSRLGFEPTKRALSRIAKEGRKYGLSLCVVSQRPSELAAGMLTQCSTIFSLRLSHHKDQELVRGSMSESAFGLLDALPSLGNAEAIAVGEGVPFPMRLAFDELPREHRPKSGNAQFSVTWQKDLTDARGFVNDVIERWRGERR
jgi:hypothetical protein